TPILVTQKRKYPKVTPSFTVTPTENLGKVQTVTTPAQFPGGIDQLDDFIKKNIQYPESALKKNIEGTVLISFTITKDGYHRDYKILKGLSLDCDDEVLRVIKKSPNWQPAIDHDQAVAVQEIVSVEFKLTDN
ncbi:MAG TPA: energy transducer TonB, partial [Mucilaginibacter sp.]